MQESAKNDELKEGRDRSRSMSVQRASFSIRPAGSCAAERKEGARRPGGAFGPASYTHMAKRLITVGHNLDPDDAFNTPRSRKGHTSTSVHKLLSSQKHKMELLT
jgi:hypothetical protein